MPGKALVTVDGAGDSGQSLYSGDLHAPRNLTIFSRRERRRDARRRVLAWIVLSWMRSLWFRLFVRAKGLAAEQTHHGTEADLRQVEESHNDLLEQWRRRFASYQRQDEAQNDEKQRAASGCQKNKLELRVDRRASRRCSRFLLIRFGLCC